MPVIKRLLFVLIGDDKTGKTTFQKLIIEKVHGISYESLPCNKAYDVKNPAISESYSKISYSNRSYQEKVGTATGEYKSIDDYFERHFNPTDIAILSSHLTVADVEAIIEHGKKRFYNVIGVFFTNSIMQNHGLNSQISALNWDERLVVDNPHASTKDLIEKQLAENADSFIQLLEARSQPQKI